MTDFAGRDFSSSGMTETGRGAIHPQFRLEMSFHPSWLTDIRFASLVLDSGLLHTGVDECLHQGPLSDLVPAGFVVQATHSKRGQPDALVASAPDAHILLYRENHTKVWVRIAAPSERDVAHWKLLIDDLGQIDEVPDTIPATFWALGRNGPSSTHRSIEAVVCSDISRNYDAASKEHLEELATFGKQRNRGGLIAWFGPAGTGKTTAVRSMATAWQADRELNVVTDIEKLLHDADYLAQVTRPTVPSDGTDARAKLIVAEDVDPSLLAEQQLGGSGGLARLLGLTDGLLASATDAIVLLTTNARRHQIAPSLQRPGRCLALIEFGPLSVNDANDWLPSDVASVTEPATLAELYHRAGLVDRIGATDTKSARVGTYL